MASRVKSAAARCSLGRARMASVIGGPPLGAGDGCEPAIDHTLTFAYIFRFFRRPVSLAAMKRHALMLVVMAVLASAAGGGARAAPEVEVASALTRLAARHDFTVSGIEQARGRHGRLREGALERRLRHLLAGIDHVILRTADGRVQRVILPGGRGAVATASVAFAPAPRPPAVLALRRKGAALVMVLTLESAEGRPRPQPLLVDSGAARTLLPAPLCVELGLDLEGVAPVAIALGDAEVQALPGRLAAVRAGPRRLVEVEVGCVEGRALGGNALLGEDLLGRLGARLDRDGARLVLDPAPGD
ncbi:hypothetical protein EBL84_13545 [Marichromatium sp. AB31]|nr:hypothetical protein EBL84_13545 [Marichromatium sp. AB31]